MVHPTHKNVCKAQNSNYRPISILPNLTKTHEQLLFDQTYTFFSNFFPCQCGFCEGDCALHLAMTENMKEVRDSNKVCAAVLTDITKGFGCFLPEILIEKLHALGFDLKSLRVIRAYLNDQIQVITVGSFYSEIRQFFINSVPRV